MQYQIAPTFCKNLNRLRILCAIVNVKRNSQDYTSSSVPQLNSYFHPSHQAIKEWSSAKTQPWIRLEQGNLKQGRILKEIRQGRLDKINNMTNYAHQEPILTNFLKTRTNAYFTVSCYLLPTSSHSQNKFCHMDLLIQSLSSSRLANSN